MPIYSDKVEHVSVQLIHVNHDFHVLYDRKYRKGEQLRLLFSTHQFQATVLNKIAQTRCSPWKTLWVNVINLTLPLPVLSAVYNFRFGGCIQTSQEFYKPLLEAPTGLWCSWLTGPPRGRNDKCQAGAPAAGQVPATRVAQSPAPSLRPQLAAAGPEQGRERDGKISPVSGPLFIDCPRFLPNLTFSTCPALSTVKENSTLLIDRKWWLSTSHKWQTSKIFLWKD